MKTAIITSESSEKHITGDGHPEQPKRVVSIIDTLKKNIPNSKLEIFKGCSHNVHLEEPQKFNEAVKNFLS